MTAIKTHTPANNSAPTPFILRSYNKSELAQLYSPGITPDAAVRTLKKWIRLHPTLLDELKANGYLENLRNLSPKQVQIIVDALGEPL